VAEGSAGVDLWTARRETSLKTEIGTVEMASTATACLMSIQITHQTELTGMALELLTIREVVEVGVAVADTGVHCHVNIRLGKNSQCSNGIQIYTCAQICFRMPFSRFVRFLVAPERSQKLLEVAEAVFFQGCPSCTQTTVS